MLEFFSRIIITHCFHVENVQGNTCIGYELIIGHDMMVQLALKADFGRQILERDEAIISMKETGSFLFQPDLTRYDMPYVAIPTE